MDIRISQTRKRHFNTTYLLVLLAAVLFFVSITLKYYYWTHSYLETGNLYIGSEIIFGLALAISVRLYLKREAPESRIWNALKNEKVLFRADFKPSWQLYKSAIIVMVALIWLVLVIECLSWFQTYSAQPEYVMAFTGLLLFAACMRILWVYIFKNPFCMLITEKGIISYSEAYREWKWSRIQSVDQRGSQIFLFMKNGDQHRIELSDLGAGRHKFIQVLKERSLNNPIPFKTWN